jgi:single-strand DNA-binding protein
MNKVILLGNLGADPELRYTANGQPVLHLRIATNESWLDKNRESQERTEWHTVVIWGPRGEALSKILTKGSSVLVEGGLRTSSYDKDGIKRYKTEIVARDVFLTGRRPTTSSPATGDDDVLRMTPPPSHANGKSGGVKAAVKLDDLPF